MNIPEQVKGGRELIPRQYFDLTVPVGRPGRISVFATARRRSLHLSAPARYLLELYAPGTIHPAAYREVEGTGLLGILEYDARMTGGGFGGCVVALCRSGALTDGWLVRPVGAATVRSD